MKVSVIIPAYNEAKYLGKVLRSLSSQTVPPDEIIVVDNNSTDKTATIAKSLGAKVITEKKQGITPARDRGFNSSKYEIIARCDADTLVPKDWIEKIKDNFANPSLDALSGPVIYYDARYLNQSSLPSRFYFKTLYLLTGKRLLVGMNMILTRKIWEKVRKTVMSDDSKVHEDVDLSLKIAKVGGKIGFDKKLVVKASCRRIIHKPKSFFLEYPLRLLKTFWVNRGL